MKEEDKSDEWIEARDALKWVADAFSDQGIAKAKLEDALISGELSALADDMIIEPDMGPVGTWIKDKKIRRIIRQSGAEPRGNVTKNFWKRRRESFYDKNLWDWDKNTFCTTDDPEVSLVYEPETTDYFAPVGKRHIMYGVSFLRSEIINFIATHGPKVVRAKGLRIKKSTGWDWDEVLVPLWELVAAGTLEREFGNFKLSGSQVKLEERITLLAQRDGGKTPSEATARRQARMLIAEFEARHHSKSNEP